MSLCKAASRRTFDAEKTSTNGLCLAGCWLVLHFLGPLHLVLNSLPGIHRL